MANIVYKSLILYGSPEETRTLKHLFLRQTAFPFAYWTIGAVRENRTLLSSLEDSHNIQYMMTASGGHTET